MDAGVGAAADGGPPRGIHHSGGPSQPEAGLKTPLPSYLNTFSWSLQMAGASGYFPHWTVGGPSANGPLNPFASAAIASGDSLSGPTAFIHFTMVRSSAKVMG